MARREQRSLALANAAEERPSSARPPRPRAGCWAWTAQSALPETRRSAPLHSWTIPNAIGFVRIALIGPSSRWRCVRRRAWSTPATILFAVIAWSDYLDGLAARITGQYSRPARCWIRLTDRLLVISGAIVAWSSSCCLAGPWPCSAREALMLLLTRMALRRGLDIEINTLGRWAVWPTMSALAAAMIAETWLSDVLYVGLAMTLAATAIYIRDGLGGSRRPDPQALLENRSILAASSSRKEPQAPMETFPDLGALSDQELKDMIQQLSEEENAVSYRRRSCTARSTSCGPSSSTGCERSTRPASR